MKRLLFASFLLLVMAACSRREPLPHLYPLPAETPLVGMDGRPFQLGQLRGNVLIYDFIFTRCRGICPLLTQRMKQVASKIDRDERVRFASISVDPIHDTPDVLRRYAKQNGADERWMFLTGDRKTIVDLSVHGFKLAAGDTTPNPDEPILHSTKFVLVDGAGTIRGYYDSNEAQALETLARDAVALSEELN